MNISFIGLDGEMTGCDYTRHKLIQIGVALSEEDIFFSNIGWNKFEYDSESLLIVGVSPNDIINYENNKNVDDKLVLWLESKNIERESLIPVGWGVDVFDRPFIKNDLPKFYSFLHRHSVDLNSIIYYLGDIKSYLGKIQKAYTWKKMAKYMGETFKYVIDGLPIKKHNAGDDALLSLSSWRWLRNILLDESPGKLPKQEIKPSLNGRIFCSDATREFDNV